ncbi:MAG: glycoside hydrolase [Clostridium sp.]|nr:glycoside hydrolase [Clostridium sp.]
MIRRKKSLLTSILAMTIGFTTIFPAAIAKADSFDYNTAFKDSIYFYDANKCGKDAGENNYFSWRGACHTQDSINGIDLSGGYHDAGDHVKFGLPQGYAASVLGWSLYEFGNAYAQVKMKDKALEQLKHFTDYFLKCHPKADKFYYQVGHGGDDHSYWGAPEKQDNSSRTYIKEASQEAASDIAGETSAALSLMYLNYKSKDSAYADRCLKAAKELYEMGKNHRGKGGSQGFYDSSHYDDDLTWAGIWLYKATSNSQYLSEAKQFIKLDSQWLNTNWTMCWNDMKVPATLMLYRLTGDKEYKDAIDYNMNCWKQMQPTPGGLKFLNKWGPLRYAASASMMALLYYNDTKDKSLVDFAKSQLEYIMGKNPENMSYIVGFGNKWPKSPHHRAANGYTYENQDYKTHPNKHVVTGALVGGPDSNDRYPDQIDLYENTEVSIDYNAGLVGALAGYINLTAKPDDGEKVLYGDVDNNKKVDMFDYILLKQYLSHIKSDADINKKAADVNQDGKVNVKDLLELRTMF